ncbi:MAG TPA: barnase inhibitor [Epulopiscium sp.]|nr:barnase inhibitor [Candidatus Epulonipiscium sp.]
MIKVTLNGKNMNSKKRAHEYIKWKLKAEEYYGDNLDALWDVLSTYDRPTEISFINMDSLIEALADYGESIVSVFKEASEENENIKLGHIG